MIEHTGDGRVHVLTMQNEQNLVDLPFLAHLHEALDQVEAESEGDADGDPFREAAFAHVRRTVRDKLLVTNPGWLGE
jgi:hypothetical protein